MPSPDILTLQFVDGPSAAATLRYDFNTKNSSYYAHPLNEGGFDLGVPAWSGEPEGVGGVYGYRQMRFTQRVEGTKANAMARMAALAREMMRATNWLKVQLSTSLAPVYFKIYRGDPGALSIEHVESSQAWDITVPLTADPLAYGARVTLSTVVLGNSLSAGNPMRYVLPALKGDAPTGLRIKVTPLANTGYTPALLLALVAADATVSDTTVDIGTGDVWTAGVNTGAPVSNAAYLEGEYRLASVTADDLTAGSNFQQRLSGTLAAAPPLGQYKVLLRCEADPFSASVAETYLFALGQGMGGGWTYGDTVTMTTPFFGATAYTFQGWVDLGDFNFPFATTTPSDVTATPTAPSLSLKVGTAGNRTAVVRLDCFKFIPLDGPQIRRTTLLKSDIGTTNAVPVNNVTSGTWDADTELYYGTAVTGGALRDGNPAKSGSFPIADPAATQNLLVCMPLSRGLDNSTTDGTAVASTWNLDLSYYPRYLHVGDGT